MKLVYSHENIAIVRNVQNILEHAGFQITLRNEFSASAAGDLAPTDTWMELWVQDGHCQRAADIIEKTFNPDEILPSWVCKTCKEDNEGNFELCWNCQTEND
jgi:hypothetical protein